MRDTPRASLPPWCLHLVHRAALLALCLALTCGAVGRGRAFADELVLDAGRDMLAYTHASRLDPERTLVVNGARMHVLSGHTADGITALLDVFEARCRRASGGLDHPERLLGRRRWPRIAERALDPVLRSERAHAGYVACLDLGGGPLTAEDLVSRARRFVSTRDLGELGDVRFAWAFRELAGTSYVAVYNDGPMPLAALFPKRGDAAGIDVPGVPRPSHARRVLSAYQDDAAPMLASYVSEQTPERALDAFHAQLAAAGLLPSTREAGGELSRFVVTRGARTALAFATRSLDGRTLLTVVLLH